ncbi:YdcF family protein [Vagococcus fluvialis]|uniref:YdcF family protein n=1 Tax=Vagococcus fluvialis TaxID=2738 RepID=UPI001A8FEC9B|nr:YdcF family protein [Vagococcus fluvialis]MBO0438420.1 YdcF family protein [Vagococcus fluvialis]
MLFFLLFVAINTLLIFAVNKIFLKKFYLSRRQKHVEYIIYILCSSLLYIFFIGLISADFYFLIPLFFLILFLTVYKLEKRRLINGMLFNLFFSSIIIYLIYIYFITKDSFISIILTGMLTIGSIILSSGIYFLLFFLLWNAKQVKIKENTSLSNSLTLLLSLLIIIFGGTYSLVYLELPIWLAVIFGLFILIILYFSIIFYNFLTISIIYQFNNPIYDQDYIIVLGSGLIDGNKVSKLLSSRIDKAIKFYQQQKKISQKPLKLIMSGGRGADELISEAEAMKNYALQVGIPSEDILIEDQSTTTEENLLFSKNIMEISSKPQSYNAIFTTNNYHVFRASLFARKVGLDADGIGAKTAFYFLPNAILREYVAILLLKKKQHIIIVSLVSIIMFILSFLSFFWFK